MAIDYEEAKKYLANPISQNVNRLEHLLELDGFTNKIDPLKLGRAQWYFNHIETKPENMQQDFLTPYTRGFVRVKDLKYTAAYGIVTQDDTLALRGKNTQLIPAHFFYITKDSEEAVRLLTTKAEQAMKSIDNYIKSYNSQIINGVLYTSQFLLWLPIWFHLGSEYNLDTSGIGIGTTASTVASHIINKKVALHQMRKLLMNKEQTVIRAQPQAPEFGIKGIKNYNKESLT
jgi:hypothetical protein